MAAIIITADTPEDMQRETAVWLEIMASQYRRSAIIAERKRNKKLNDTMADAYSHAAKMIRGAIIERKQGGT